MEEDINSLMNNEFLDIAFRSDKGMVRESNEDAVGVLPDKGFVMVADGMGGCKAGEVASQLAVDIISAARSERYASETLMRG